MEREINLIFRESPLEIEADLASIDLSKAHMSRSDVQEIISVRPKNLDLYRRAFVHASIKRHVKWSIANNKEVQEYMKESFERLEFLGDAVLNLIVAKFLYHKYPDKDEGYCTRLRIKIVRGTNCTVLAKKLNLGKYILTGTKVPKLKDIKGSIINDKILEDVLEALIGALYEDLGLDYAELFVLKLINENINFDTIMEIDDNYKDILMRYTQTFKFDLPIYESITIDSIPRIFKVNMYLRRPGAEKKLYGVGTSRTKKQAEQNAAQDSICKKIRIECRCNKIHSDEIKDIIERNYDKDSDNEY